MSFMVQLECDPTILEEHESNTEQFSFWVREMSESSLIHCVG